MIRGLPLVLFLFAFQYTFSQLVSGDYYLPNGVSYDSTISLPNEIIGHEVGEFHVTHDKLVNYLHHLAAQSDRIQIETYGYSHEKRPLLLLTISSEKNLAAIEQIKVDRLKLRNGEKLNTSQLKELPIVIWLGYSVHGDESSGSNASLLLAYYLAAAQGDKIDELLSSAIIILDPSINPDGLQRFSSWVNANKSNVLIGDVNNREYNEPWPKGRTNHYWFDLNRDWLLLQQPETRAKIFKYHEWSPNVVTDHHEMGINSTLFFQPGVTSRKHPLTPQENENLTEKLANFHAKVLDDQQELYFTKENFDDYYYGKGSTYPDLQGAIGILFEQASTRGLLRETDNGTRDFPSTIKNQLTVSLSTLEGSLALKPKLIEYQNNFYYQSKNAFQIDPDKGYIFGDETDQIRVNKLAQILLDHQITLYKPKIITKKNNKTFYPENSFIVPLEQLQYLLIKALFERRREFNDSLFYDVSAWSMDLAFNLDFETLNAKEISAGLIGERIVEIAFNKRAIPEKSNYAYAIKWDQYYAPAALYKLLDKGIKVKVSEAGFTDKQGNTFPKGSLLILSGIQNKTDDEIYNLIQSVSDMYYIEVFSLESGTNSVGIDLGSPQITSIEKPKILLLTGDGINATEAGEIWHLLDLKMNIPVTLLPAENFSKVKLGNYTTLIIPDGSVENLSSNENIKNWLIDGGILIAQNDALRSLKNNGIYLGNFKGTESGDLLELSYEERDEYKGAQHMAGAIFQTTIDRSHPLCFGYEQDELAVFKNSKVWLERSNQIFNNPVLFTNNPLLSGYISSKNVENLQNTAGISVLSYGQGKIIAFSFDPNFRGFWYGTEKLFLNSIFFGQIVKTQL